MPNIRFVNWNIEKLSGNKIGIAGISAAIGEIISTSQADILIVLELSSGTAQVAMTAVSNAANAAAVAAGGGANDYTGWLLSNQTGFECYGILIRDLNEVRPIQLNPPAAGIPDGTSGNPLVNIDSNTFSTWPAPLVGAGAVANAYPGLAAPAARPLLPLTDIFATTPPTGRKRRRFSGQTLAVGGYAAGRGFRMPCLAMFEIANGGGAASHIVPVLVCHLGAVRGGANHLARGQVAQYKATHIAQKYNNGGYIDLNNTAVPIQELMITGDFNIDFLIQAPPMAAAGLPTGNRIAMNSVTPTSTDGGSAAPAAIPGVPGAVPAVPFVMPVVGWPEGPIATAIAALALRSAETSVGTILHHYAPAAAVPANLAALRGACFDNFFFGGTQLSATMQTLTPAPPAANAADIQDVPAMIVQAGAGGAGAVDVSATQAHYAAQFAAAIAAAAAAGLVPPPPPHFHYAYAIPNLAPGAPAAALTTNDQLIGARFISDHLPTIIQFNLP